MKTKNEKSMEQEALDEYAWKKGTKKFIKQFNTAAFFAGVITYVSFVIWFSGGLSFVLSIGPAMLAVGIILVLSMPFSGLYRGEKKREKIIAALSDEEKKKMVMDYVNKQIQDIQKTKKAYEEQIFQLHQSIYQCDDELGNLEVEFFPEKYKKKHMQNDYPLPSTPRPSDFWTSKSAHEDDGACD